MVACECSDVHKRRRVVLTGGPGAGKTALLELIREILRGELPECCQRHVIPALRDHRAAPPQTGVGQQPAG